MQQQPGADPAGAGAAGSKACATCRLAHVACDREQPCGRCVRLGKADSCQQPPMRKRGRPPRKTTSSPDDDQSQPVHSPHHRQPPPLHTTFIATIAQAQSAAVAASSKRLCVRPKTTRHVVDPSGGDSQPPHATPAGHHSSCSSSPSSSSSPPPSSLQHRSLLPPPVAEEDCASSWSSSSSPSSPPPLQSALGFAPWALPADQGRQCQEQDSQEEGLRSLLMLVVDQVREMRRENDRLRDTIAQLQATQSESESRLARVEQDNETKSRQLEQTRIELKQTRMELNKKIDDHVMLAQPCPPPRPRCDSSSQSTAQSGAGAGVLAEAAAVAVARPTAPGADVERFFSQMFPFLSAFDRSSLFLSDLQRPFLVMRLTEAETLDDIDTPTIAYASPSMCNLLGYDQCEMLGSPVSWFGGPDPEYLSALVREMLIRSLTPVGQPLVIKGWLVPKQGHSMRVVTQHQTVYNQRHLAEWSIMQVDSILETRPQAFAYKGLYNPARPMPLYEVLREPTIRAHLLSGLPHSLLFGRGGGCGELTLQRPSLSPPSRPDARLEREEDGELEELVRALDLPTQMFDHHLHQPLGCNAPTPTSLAERWMR